MPAKITDFDLAVFEALPMSFRGQAFAAWIARALGEQGISTTDNAVRRSLERLAKAGFSICSNKRKSPPYGWFCSDLLGRFGHYHGSLVWETRCNFGFGREDLTRFVQARHPEWLQAVGGSDADAVCDWLFQEALDRCHATWVGADGEVEVRLLGFCGFYWLRRADGLTVGVYASPDDAVSQFDDCIRGEGAMLAMKPYRYFDYLSDEDREWLRENATAQSLPAIVGGVC